MNKNVLIVLAGGFVVAILVAVLVQASLGGSKKSSGDDNTPKSQVLVAAKNLSLGTNLTDADLKWQTWPGTPFQGAIVRKGDEKATDALSGRLIQKISEGQPVLRNAVFKEGRGNLVAASLGAGMRAVSIPVKAPMMAGGFVKPGDYVDVILTYRVRVTGNAARAVAGYVSRYATETIIKNVRVVAVDQDAKPSPDDKGKIGKTVTIEVSPDGAEKLALANEMGDITLSLRGLGDQEDEKTDSTTTDVQVSSVMRNIASMNGSGGSAGNAVRIYNGANMVEQEPRSARPVSMNAGFDSDLEIEGGNDTESVSEADLGRMVFESLLDGSIDVNTLRDLRDIANETQEDTE
jgi:pilus assembly protein CpaB